MALSKIESQALDVGQIGGRRNLIINGAMQVAQRGTSTSMAHDGTREGYSPDRFTFIIGGNLDQFDGTLSQATDAPDGYSNSLKWTTGTAETTVDADDIVYLQQKIEAQSIQHLQYGTSGAKQVTVSFWVKSSQTGTFGISLFQADGARNIGSTYAISSANTWEQKTLTFAGDTGGTINNDNGEGLRVVWHLASGSDFDSTDNTSWGAYSGSRWAYGHAQDGVVTTLSATFQITGVQLEVGTVATPFEHRSYGEELALCQRYYEVIGNGADDSFATIGMGYYYSASSVHFPLRFAVKKRTKLYSLDATSGTNYYSGYRAGGMDDFNSFLMTRRRPEACLLYNNSQTSGTTGSGFEIVLNSASAFVAIDDEL